MTIGKIKVWDLPTRLFHWSLAASFTIAYLTSESERWRDLHVNAGYAVAGLIAFRLVWGLVGTRHARFADFLRSPARALAYLRQLWQRSPPHYTGHNPAGGWAIVLLLALALASGASGWASYQELGGHWLEEGHEFFAASMLVVVGAHVLGVLVGSLAHGENLLWSMVSGRKQGRPEEALASPRRLAGLTLVAWTGLAVWWLVR